MGKYRPVYTKIWSDPDFQEYEPDNKLLFLYVCTNTYITESGIYPITIKTINYETGLGYETIEQQFANGLLKNVFYDFDHKYIFVKNLKRYNPGGKPELVIKSIQDDFQCSRYCIALWNLFFNAYPEYAKIKPMNFPDATLSDRNLPNLIATTVSYPIDRLDNGSATVEIERKNGDGTVLQPLPNGLVTDDTLKRVISLYQENIGLITPICADELKFIAQDFPVEWFEEAVKEAVTHNARNLKYIKVILETWKDKGFKFDTRKSKSKNKANAPFVSRSSDDVLGLEIKK
jgi:DnaD/phage-associated family protein